MTYDEIHQCKAIAVKMNREDAAKAHGMTPEERAKAITDRWFAGGAVLHRVAAPCFQKEVASAITAAVEGREQEIVAAFEAKIEDIELVRTICRSGGDLAGVDNVRYAIGVLREAMDAAAIRARGTA